MVFLCSVEFCFSPFFFRTCFILCLFRGDEWHNYFTSVIDLYNRLLSKIGPFKSSGEFSITNSLKFGFSLFCWVLLLALFFRTCFYFVFFWFVSFFLTVIYNWEALSIFSDRQQISLKKPIMQLNKVHRQNRNKMSEDRRRKLKANHQHFNNWIYFFYFFIIFFNSLKFGFSLFCWVLHVAYFFLPVFTSCSFVFFVFFLSSY